MERSSALNAAIDRIVAAGRALSIPSVAREVNVTPALIHNTYPEVKRRIRELTGADVPTKNSAKAKLTVSKQQNAKLLAQNRQLAHDNRRLASLLQGALFELALEKAKRAANVVDLSTVKRSRSAPEDMT